MAAASNGIGGAGSVVAVRQPGQAELGRSLDEAGRHATRNPEADTQSLAGPAELEAQMRLTEDRPLPPWTQQRNEVRPQHRSPGWIRIRWREDGNETSVPGETPLLPFVHESP